MVWAFLKNSYSGLKLITEREAQNLELETQDLNQKPRKKSDRLVMALLPMTSCLKNLLSVT